MSGADIDYERMFGDLPAGYMMLDMNMRFMDMNHAYLETVGRSREELMGQYIFDAFPEEGERLDTFISAFERAIAGEANTVVRQPFAIQQKEGAGGGSTTLYWNCHHRPVYDGDGVQRGILQRAENVTAEVDAERMRDIVLRELDHRVKNHLTIISAIARRTADIAGDTETFLNTFEQRIAAMARTHQLLVDGKWDGLTLEQLVKSELLPYCSENDDKVRIHGIQLTLTNAQAQSLGLAIHELTTNAAKHGALSAANGHLDVTWEDHGKKREIEFNWVESGMENISAPTTSGFGSAILERILPAETSAKVSRSFKGGGMTCQIVLPYS